MESVALVFQLTVIDKRMLLEKIGELDEEEKKQVGILLKELLRL
jgi:mRNA-degrading endonuclease toxin of MazEF toxin-antitoxin module